MSIHNTHITSSHTTRASSCTKHTSHQHTRHTWYQHTHGIPIISAYTQLLLAEGKWQDTHITSANMIYTSCMLMWYVSTRSFCWRIGWCDMCHINICDINICDTNINICDVCLHAASVGGGPLAKRLDRVPARYSRRSQQPSCPHRSPHALRVTWAVNPDPKP